MMVFTLMKIWVVMSQTEVVGYQCFRAPCCFHLQGEVSGARNQLLDPPSGATLILFP
jgi:hypothetical protein